jgi:hypothetical protein
MYELNILFLLFACFLHSTPSSFLRTVLHHHRAPETPAEEFQAVSAILSDRNDGASQSTGRGRNGEFVSASAQHHTELQQGQAGKEYGTCNAATSQF